MMGRCLEAILRAEPGVASRGCGSQPQAREARGPARQALRPGCEELAVRIGRKCPRWKRGPRPKIATVERREASVPESAKGRATSRRAWIMTVRLSALRHPLSRMAN